MSYGRPLGTYNPLFSTSSALRNSVLNRQTPVRTGLALLKVSPNAMSIWCSSTAVSGLSLMPLSHMMPRSVPPIPKRAIVLFRLPAPDTNSMKCVLPLTDTGVRVVPGYVGAAAAAAVSGTVKAATGVVPTVLALAVTGWVNSRREPRPSSAIANGAHTGARGTPEANAPMPRLDNRFTATRSSSGCSKVFVTGDVIVTAVRFSVGLVFRFRAVMTVFASTFALTVSSTVPDSLVFPAFVAVTLIVRAARLVVVTAARSLDRAVCSATGLVPPPVGSGVVSSAGTSTSTSTSTSASASTSGSTSTSTSGSASTSGSGSGRARVRVRARARPRPRVRARVRARRPWCPRWCLPRWWPPRYPKWTAYRAWTPMTPISGNPTRCRPTPPHAPSRWQLRPPELQPIRRRDQRMQMHPLLFP